MSSHLFDILVKGLVDVQGHRRTGPIEIGGGHAHFGM